MSFTFTLRILLLISFSRTISVNIGKIQHLSIRNNSPVYPSSDINCINCLCDCFNSSSCLGMNCFPSNFSCQLIYQQSWILESDMMMNLSSNNCFTMKQNLARLCSCYTPQNILDAFGRLDSSNIQAGTNISSIKYIPDDGSLIAINSTSIQKLSAKNLSILRNLSTSNYAISILHNQSVIYIAFIANRSINLYDLNLTFLRTSVSWSNPPGIFTGMFLWNNNILIVDALLSVIWSINSLDQSTLTTYFNFSSYNISNPSGLFIYQNESLYIASLTKNLYIFNLTNFALKQIITLSVNVPMIYMRYDANCDRLWFGSQNYTYAPVFDLASNQMNIYQTKGSISKSGINSIDFDMNYNGFYADTNGNLQHMFLQNMNC